MKKTISIFLVALFLLSSCGTSNTAVGVGVGASIGGNVGNALGGIIGDNRHGPHGAFRGSAIGTLVGTLAGAAIGYAVTTAPKEPEQEITDNGRYADDRYAYEDDSYNTYPPAYDYQPNRSVVTPVSPSASLRIRNIRFIDESRNQTINRNENCKIIFEVMNESNETVYNVIPFVRCPDGEKQVTISPSVLVEQIPAHEGIRYTAHVYGTKRLKGNELLFQTGVTDRYGNVCDSREFSLPTAR